MNKVNTAELIAKKYGLGFIQSTLNNVDKANNKELEKLASLASAVGHASRYLSKPGVGPALINWGAPAGIGGLAGLEAHNAGFDPFESAMLGLSAGAFASPKGLLTAVNKGLMDDLEGPVGGIFKNLKGPLTNKALIAGVGLAPGLMAASSNILGDVEGITDETRRGMAGFEETGQKIQRDLQDIGTNLEETTRGTRELTDTLKPAAAGLATMPDTLNTIADRAGEKVDAVRGDISNYVNRGMDDLGTGGKWLLGGLASTVGLTGAYLIMKRLFEHKEKMERYALRKARPPKRRPIKIDPGDFDLAAIDEETLADLMDRQSGDRPDKETAKKMLAAAKDKAQRGEGKEPEDEEKESEKQSSVRAQLDRIKRDPATCKKVAQLLGL